MFALRKALDMLFAEGLDNVFLRHRLLAEAVRRACAVGKQGNVIDFNVVEPGDRSDAVTTVLMSGYDPKLLRAYCDTKCGVVLGHGIGKLSGKAFRIAHMGHLNAPDGAGHARRHRDGARRARRRPRQGRRSGGGRMVEREREAVNRSALTPS